MSINYLLNKNELLMILTIKRLKTQLLIGTLILCTPFLSFSQGTDFPVNQKGHWVKIVDDKIGTKYSASRNRPQRSVAAAGPNSILAQRRITIDGQEHLAVLKFSDRGESWDYIYKNSNPDISGEGIAHPKEDVVGMLVNKNFKRPAFLYSTDGGDNFQKVQHEANGGIIKGEDAINISMYDEKHWAFTTHDEFSLKDHTYVYITHDGGKTWEEKHLKVDKTKRGVYQVVMRTPDKISLFPKFQGDAKTRISTDGGKTWQAYSEMPDKAIGWRFSIEFTGPKTGYVGGQFRRGRAGPDTGKIFKTTDGGRSWDLILNTPLPAPVSGIWEIDFINKKEGLALGEWGKNTLRTTDGGKTWIRDSVASAKPATNLEVVYTQKGDEKLALATKRGRGDVFRFKVTDTTSSTTGKERIKSREQGLALYPNPSDGRLQIRWQGKNAVTGKLYNMQGQVVRNFNLTPGQQETYSLTGIKPGTYVFKVNGRDITKKVLIQGQAD
jgi:photosystem II stability/assembly factor-like uncharacterized protein